jgi:septum site-determining protein MinC
MAVIGARASASANSNPALELKGTISPVTVLCLHSTEIGRIERELAARVEAASQMFDNAPIVIDVADIEGELDTLSLAEVMGALRACRMIPIGVAHLPPDRIELAAQVGLAVLQLGFGRSRGARANSPHVAPPPPTAAPAAVAAPAAPASRPIEPAAPTVAPTMTITQPVRGGQVIYAQRCDLVVLAPVNPGAQVIADGHVHVYGRLRGRALAGARGQTDARVFCQSLEAELVSVNGEFLTADDLPEKIVGRPAQVFVEHGMARVAPL